MPSSSTSTFDITKHTLSDHDSVGSPTSHIWSLTLFRDDVVHPSLKRLDAEINRWQNSEEPVAAFAADDYEGLFQTTLEGYLIAVQSMWERGIRNMLIRRAKKRTPQINTKDIERAPWENKNNLQLHFHKLMGLPLTAFESYQDLDFLQNIANAIRHGDGPAAQKVHKLSPRLWINWLEPGQEIMAGPFRIASPKDGPMHPPFNKITLPQELLDQMIQSVLWFWEDIENIQCNSFTQKHLSVVQKLAAWKDELQSRRTLRVWQPSDGAFPLSRT